MNNPAKRLPVFVIAAAALLGLFMLGRAVTNVSAAQILAAGDHSSRSVDVTVPATETLEASSTPEPRETETPEVRTLEPKSTLEVGDDHGQDQAVETEVHHSADDSSVVDDHGGLTQHSDDISTVVDDHGGQTQHNDDTASHTSQDDGGSHHGGNDGGGHK